jgi:hypothetical protein
LGRHARLAWAVRSIAREKQLDPHEEMLNDIALEIERHLAEKPGAADSAEGIRAWWLPARLRAAPLEHVIEALDRLQKAGVVEKTKAGLGYVYGAAPSTPTRH